MPDHERRLALRSVIAVALFLVLVPASQLLARTMILSDQLPVLESSGSLTEVGIRVAPPHPVGGVVEGDVVASVNGRSPASLMSDPGGRTVARGDEVRLRVVRGDDAFVTTVRIERTRRFGGLATEVWPLLVSSMMMLGPAIWLVRRRPDQPVAHALLLFASSLLSLTIASLANSEPLDYWARPYMVAWSILGRAGFLVLPVALLLFALAFPKPGQTGRAIRVVRGLMFAPSALATVIAACYLLGAWSLSADRLVDALAGGCWLLGTLTALVVLVTRIWRTRQDIVARRQGQIVLTGLMLSLLPWMVLNLVPNHLGAAWFAIVFLPFPASIAIAAGNQNLFDLDLVLNRGLVATLTTALLLIVYAGVVAASTLLFGGSGPLVAVPAAGAVAILFAPVRDRSQRWVGHRLYGLAADPGIVFERLGRRLSDAADPDALLTAIVETVTESLRLPYVAIELHLGDVDRVVLQRGQPGVRVEHVDLLGDGRLIGRLLVSPRRGEDGLSNQDTDLLANLGRHAAVAAQVSQLNNTLREAQHQNLVAREAERDRVQRDLHDRVGPVLVGLALQLSVIEGDPDPRTASARLERLGAQLHIALEDVRRLARDLRPTELEHIGLSAAIEAAANRLSNNTGMQFNVRLPLVLPRLTRECEDAAYIVMLEAMTNAVRHSGGRRGTVRLAADSAQTVEGIIDDDGVGIPAGVHAGTGLRSMRIRVANCGGQFAVLESPSGGTRISFHLPIAPAS